MKYTIRGNLPRQSDDYVADVLRARGISDPDRYRRPSKGDLHNPALLDGVVEGVQLLKKHIALGSKFFLQVD